jgi:hypothetical protein
VPIALPEVVDGPPAGWLPVHGNVPVLPGLWLPKRGNSRLSAAYCS